MSNVKTLTVPVNYWGDTCDTLVINPSTQNNNATMQVVAQVAIVPAANVVNGAAQVSNAPNPQVQGQMRFVKGFGKQVVVTVTSMEPAAIYAAVIAASGYTVNA